VISAAEPHDNQIVIVQVRQLTGRRDKSYRLLASLLCVSRLQAESYLAADLRAEPGYPAASASISVIVDLPSLVTGLVIGTHLQVTQPGLQDL
jgi:hypothetical protein